MNQHNIDICALSETKKRGKGTAQHQNYTLIYSGKDKDKGASSGVGLLIHEKYKQNIDNIEYVNDRILKTTLIFEKKHLHIISVYAPDASKPNQEAEQFYDQLQIQIDKTPHTERLVIMGDLNARIGNDVIEGVKQKYHEATNNERGDMLIELCTHNELRINNTFFPHKQQHKITFTDNRNNSSMIDYIITNRAILPNQIRDVRSLTSANIGSDHNLVLCKMRIIATPAKRLPPNKVQKYNIESLVHESTRKLYIDRLQQCIRSNSITEDDNIECGWNKIKTNIHKAAQEAIGTRTVDLNAKPNPKPWFTEEVKTIAEEKKRAYLQYLQKKTAEEHAHYIEVRNQVNSRIREIKKEYWERFSSEIEHDMYGTQKRVWKILRGMKKTVNEDIQIKTISEEEWTAYFEQLYAQTENNLENQEHQEGNEQREENVKNEPTRLITEEQVKIAIGGLKNRKAPGEDDIANELIKHGGDPLAPELRQLFNNIIKHSEVPSEWRKSITIPIFKKGCKKEPSNYRGITLLSAVMKLFTSILADEIRNNVPMNEEQHGFRKNRSTIDAIFILRQVIEKSLEHNTPAYICFFDLTKAFDRVRLADVIKTLEEKSAPPEYIRIIESLNTNNTTKIRVRNKLTKEVATPTGIRQGDSLSPLLFNLIMDKIIDAVKVKPDGYRLGDRQIKIVCYADDAALIAGSEDELQRLLHAFKLEADKYNMMISTSKTKCMTIAREPLRCKVAVDNHIIEQVKSFNYLGARISSYGDLTNDIKQQVNKAGAISGHLKNTIWKNTSLTEECKTRIYKTCIRPILTYAGETRADTAATKRLLRTTEMKTLRTITGHTLLDRKRNSYIREQCKVDDVVRWLRKRRRQWNEHVSRMDDNRMVKVVRNGKPQGKRLPGRPYKRWRDSWHSTSQEQN